MMRAMNLPKHEHIFTLGALLKPSLHQSGLSSSMFQSDIQKRWLGRVIVGLWFLLLIVICNEYKSEVTSAVVVPTFTKPPETFKELSDSDYSLYAVFWSGNLEEAFKSSKSSYSDSIVGRVKERNYFDKDVS